MTTVVALLALAATAGVASASPTAGAAQTDANLTAFVAPGPTLDGIRTGTATDRLTRRQRVTPADTLVLRVSAPGLGAAVAAQPGNTTTTRFRSLLSGPDTSLTGVEIGSGDDPPRALDLTPAHLVVRRVAENTFDLIYDTDRLRATDDTDGDGRPDEGPGTPVDPVRVFEIAFTHESASATTSLGLFPVAVSFSTPPADGVVLYPLPEQRLVGRTSLAPGTPLAVSLDADGLRVERTTFVTGRRQSFANLSLNLTGAPAGVPLTVTARLDGRLLRRTTGRLAEPTASFATDRTAPSRTRLRLRNVSFATGGFLVVRDGRAGRLLAVRHVEPGEYDSLTVRYRRAATADSVAVTAYVDVDGDGVFDGTGPDRPFRRDGAPVTTVVDLAASTATPSDTRTAVSTTATPTAAPTTAPSAPDATGSPTRYRVTDASGGGFGLAAALAALAIGFAALARRR